LFNPTPCGGLLRRVAAPAFAALFLPDGTGFVSGDNPTHGSRVQCFNLHLDFFGKTQRNLAQSNSLALAVPGNELEDTSASYLAKIPDLFYTQSASNLF